MSGRIIPILLGKGQRFPGIGPLPTPWSFDSSLELSWPLSVQSLSHVWLFVAPWTAARQASLSIAISRSLLKLVPVESVMPSNHLILCHPLLLLPSIFPSIRVFSSESVLHIRWPKYWSFSFNTRPFKEHLGLISFRMDWLDGSPCCPRDSQESSPTPQFKNINSWAVNFLYGPILTSMATGKTIALSDGTLLAKSCLVFLICCLGWSY